MEFSSIWYSSFWSLISLIFVTIGFLVLERANLAVPTTIVNLFKVFITFSACLFSSYAFLLRPPLEHEQININLWHELQQYYFFLNGLYMSFYIMTLSPRRWTTIVVEYLLKGVFWYKTQRWITKSLMELRNSLSMSIGQIVLIAGIGPPAMYPCHTISWLLFMFVFLTVGCTPAGPHQVEILFPLQSYTPLALSFAHLLMMYLALIDYEPYLSRSYVVRYIYENRKTIEIIVGMLGYILLDQIFQEKSLALLWALLSFTISWLGNLAIAQPSTDFGIFNFFIGAIVDCATSLFGLRVYTWLICAACILLILLRSKLDLVRVRHSWALESVLRDWKRLEQLNYDSRIHTLLDPQV